MKALVLLLLLILPLAPANAAGVPYSQLNPQDQRDFILHGSVANAVDLSGALLFEKLGMGSTLSILLSSVLVAGAAYYKEKKMDKTYSGSDMSGGMAGVGLATLTFTVLHF